MKTHSLFLAATFSVLISACGGGADNPPIEAADTNAVDAGKVCEYAYDGSSTHLFWTAYKHTAKAEVKGAFDTLEISKTSVSSIPQGVMEGAVFTISVGSVNSKDPERDKKIIEHFFGAMIHSSDITGQIKTTEGDEVSGKVVLSVKMNNVEKDVDGSYTIDGEDLEIRSQLNFNDFNAQDAVASLNKACEEKHTGEDGQSVFWPEGTVIVRTTLIKRCE